MYKLSHGTRTQTSISSDSGTQARIFDDIIRASAQANSDQAIMPESEQDKELKALKLEKLKGQQSSIVRQSIIAGIPETFGRTEKPLMQLAFIRDTKAHLDDNTLIDSDKRQIELKLMQKSSTDSPDRLELSRILAIHAKRLRTQERSNTSIMKDELTSFNERYDEIEDDMALRFIVESAALLVKIRLVMEWSEDQVTTLAEQLWVTTQELIDNHPEVKKKIYYMTKGEIPVDWDRLAPVKKFKLYRELFEQQRPDLRTSGTRSKNTYPQACFSAQTVETPATTPFIAKATPDQSTALPPLSSVTTKRGGARSQEEKAQVWKQVEATILELTKDIEDCWMFTDPRGHCKLHQESKHSNQECYAQQNRFERMTNCRMFPGRPDFPRTSTRNARDKGDSTTPAKVRQIGTLPIPAGSPSMESPVRDTPGVLAVGHYSEQLMAGIDSGADVSVIGADTALEFSEHLIEMDTRPRVSEIISATGEKANVSKLVGIHIGGTLITMHVIDGDIPTLLSLNELSMAGFEIKLTWEGGRMIAPDNCSVIELSRYAKSHDMQGFDLCSNPMEVTPGVGYILRNAPWSMTVSDAKNKLGGTDSTKGDHTGQPLGRGRARETKTTKGSWNESCHDLTTDGKITMAEAHRLLGHSSKNRARETLKRDNCKHPRPELETFCIPCDLGKMKKPTRTKIILKTHSKSACMAMMAEKVSKLRKHIGVRWSYIHDNYIAGAIGLIWISREINPADGLCKKLSFTDFKSFKKILYDSEEHRSYD